MFDFTKRGSGCVGRSETAKPGIDVEISVAEFGYGRNVGQSLRPRAITDRECAQLSGFQIFRHVRKSREHRRHLLAQHGIERLRVSRIWHESHVGLGGALEDFKAELEAARRTDG